MFPGSGSWQQPALRCIVVLAGIMCPFLALALLVKCVCVFLLVEGGGLAASRVV